MQYHYGPLINRNTKMQNVQRRATKQLPGMKNIPYEERLQRLKLPTLAYRRTRGDMIEVYKLLHGNYDSDVSNIIKLHKDNKTVNSFINRLDEHWSTEEFLYNYKAALTGSRRAFQRKVEDLTTEATAYGQEEPK